MATQIPVQAQDTGRVRSIMHHLCSPEFSGRGYGRDGAAKAAVWIEKEFKDMGLKPAFGNGSYRQRFTMDVNIFEKDDYLATTGHVYNAGHCFMPDPSSGYAYGTFKATVADSAMLAGFQKLASRAAKNADKALVVDEALLAPYSYQERLTMLTLSGYGLVVETRQKFTWSVGRFQLPFGYVWALADSFVLGKDKKIGAAIQPRLAKDMAQFNVAAQYINPARPDSFIVVCGHYDHLGTVGSDIYCPGANDNASGTAMVLELARAVAEGRIKPRYSVIFIAFAGEEAGLLGSQHFVKRLPMHVKYLVAALNFDLIGNGSEGVMVVNGESFPDFADTLKRINSRGNYLTEVELRPQAANSDHYPFSMSNHPAVFFYLLDEYPWYHDVYDTPDKPNLEGFSGCFYLMKEVVERVRPAWFRQAAGNK